MKSGGSYMTPLIFIVIVTVVLCLLVFWVLNTIKHDNKNSAAVRNFNFESASELAINSADEFYLAQNAIKIQRCEGEYGLAFWNLSRSRWESICAEQGISQDMKRIVLRVNEAGERFNYSDMWVRTIAGQCRFHLQPETAYYVTLGIQHRKRFIPIFTSNTIIRQS